MNLDKFSKISESLRQYRRAELKDFENDLGSKPVDQLYVDPLPGDAVLKAVLSSNTTFILGRKGTGKSTIFAKAQSSLRSRKDLISIYIDVKSLYDILGSIDIPDYEFQKNDISVIAYKSHMLRKIMLGKVISELISEISKSCEKLTLREKWTGLKKQYSELQSSLDDLSQKIKKSQLEDHEIPILQKISRQIRLKNQQESSTNINGSNKYGTKIAANSFDLNFENSSSFSDFDKTLDDTDIYNEYSDVILKSFPFNEIITEIQILLKEAGLIRLIAFFDDFSELNFMDQRLFVDIVLSPLNNSSNEAIKLKIAGYSGRVYYGKIDPSKADTISLDFADIYEANEIQEMEKSASEYTHRLLRTRFKAFGEELENYFEINSNHNIDTYMKMMFRASFNVPRIMGHILHICYLDKISRNEKITITSIKLASRKYFENTIAKYFDRLNRYALEPFENKLDRHNQQQLINHVLNETKAIKRKIVDKEIGGKYFDKLGSNPPTSHFIVSPELIKIFSALESNFFLSRYKNTRDKAGKSVVVYALFLGLCESERMNWGYPEGSEYRNYFVQRCFEFTRAIHLYLSRNKTIKCNKCGFCHPIDKKESIELFKWRCPECMEGICSIVNLSDDFQNEVNNLNHEIMLEPIELEIVTTLRDENREMKAGEISALIDTTHQMVGKRTSKLQELGLIDKQKSDSDGKTRSNITVRCIETYFD